MSAGSDAASLTAVSSITGCILSKADFSLTLSLVNIREDARPAVIGQVGDQICHPPGGIPGELSVIASGIGIWQGVDGTVERGEAGRGRLVRREPGHAPNRIGKGVTALGHDHEPRLLG